MPMTKPTSEQVTFLASGTGASQRTVLDKLRDVVSVKDFGAVGDGVTDDRAAIETAMNAAFGKTLFFPPGIYAMSSASGSAERQIVLTLTNSLRMIGDSATIKCTSTTHRSHMMYLVAQGNDFSMDGLTFDANVKCNVCIRVDSSAQGTNDVSVNGCSFVNSWALVGGTGGYAGNAGAQFFGGYRFVNITNCIAADHSRELGAGIPGSAGTSGIGIAGLSTFYPQNVNVSGCLFSEITNSETTASATNYDCDGLAVFGGNTTGTTYIPSMATINNNSFVNCKGRSIKVQNDESVITNNTIMFAILPIAGGSSGGIINCQIAAGDVSHNVWHFDVAPGNLNPFDAAGTIGTVGGSCVALYPGYAHNRPRSVTAIGNVAFNNVPEATGILANMLVMGESASSTFPVFMSLKDNRVCGGAVQDFANISLRGSGKGEMYLTICDNHASKMTRSFMSNSSSGLYDKNFIVATGNVNWTATPVRHLINTSSPTNYYPANIVEFGNINIGLSDSQYRATSTAFVPRLGDIAPIDSSDGGMYSVQAVIVANDAEYSFPQKGYLASGSSLRYISSSYSGTTNFLFSQGTNTITSISAGANVSFANTTNPDVIANLNVWINSNLIRIKNRLGSSRAFTLFSMG